MRSARRQVLRGKPIGKQLWCVPVWIEKAILVLEEGGECEVHVRCFSDGTLSTLNTYVP